MIGGRSSHEECAPETEIHAPHISWEQAENLLEIVKGSDLPTDNVAVRRLIAACKAVKRSRHLATKKGPADPALPMSDAYMEAYRVILRLTHHGGEWWRPFNGMTGERWQPQAQQATAPEPERKPWTPQDEKERRDRMAAHRDKLLRRRA